MSAARQLDLAIDEYVSWIEEQAFIAWSEDTLFPHAVNCWIEQIGEVA